MIAGGVVLLAVFSLQEGTMDMKAGYQSSVVQRFDDLDQCVLAGKEFAKVHTEASFNGVFKKSSMKCLDLNTGNSTKVSL